MIFENGIYTVAEVREELGLSDEDLSKAMLKGLKTVCIGTQIVTTGHAVAHFISEGGVGRDEYVELNRPTKPPMGYKGRKVGKSGKLE